jgi:integrative and conjugative element protein (TIGR02256 family)
MSIDIEFAPGVAEQISELAALSEDGRETGGILLGRGPRDEERIEILNAGDPDPRAIRRPDFFLRDLEHAKDLAERDWRDSRAIWVGEWHTHLNRVPAPSRADLATYVRLLGGAELEFELFVSVIVTAGKDDDWRNPELFPWVMAIAESGLGIPEKVENGGSQ